MAVKNPRVEIIWEPQSGPQTALLACPVFEVFFGGARGGGKTDGMLGEWVSHQDPYGDKASGLMVRRSRTELMDTIERSRQIYTPLGAKYHEQDKFWRFGNGSRLRFAYLERDSDAEGYQGHSYTRVYVEEMGNFASPNPIFRLMATLRSAHGIPVGFRATGNPGGPGHQWIRSRYIDPAPLGWKIINSEFKNPWNGEKVVRDRVFIPSKLQDNQYLGKDYVANLQMVGNPQLVRAWLEGDWSVIEGAFFPEFSEAKHVIPPFAIPESWLRFRSADWGSAKPFSIGWWAVVGDDFRIAGRSIPRGAIIRYREWYGSTGTPDTGLKMPAEDVADGILAREVREPRNIEGKTAIAYGVLDPAAFASDGGPSIAERIARRGIFFRPADNARVGKRGAMGGWDQLRARLNGDGETPMIYLFSTCRDTIRTLPALQHDQDKPEDVDCWVAGTKIATPSGIRPIEMIAVGDFVNTPIGARRVIAAYNSGLSETIKVDLVGGHSSSGWSIEGTPRHKIYVEGRGLVALSNVQCYDVLRLRNTAWQSRGLLIAAWFTHAMRVGATTIRMARSWPQAAQACIAKFGLMRDWKFLAAFISTTEMAISTTMPYATLSVFHLESILGGIGKNGSQSWKNALSFGVPVWTDKGPCVAMQGKCWITLRDENLRADIVAASLKLSTLGRNIAQLIVPILPVVSRLGNLVRFVKQSFGRGNIKHARRKPVHIVAVGRSVELKPVYNLTVADAHLFYANDILSSNTESEDHAADDVRYACMSRPYVKQLDKKLPGKIVSVGPTNEVSLQDLWDEQPAKRKSERV